MYRTGKIATPVTLAALAIALLAPTAGGQTKDERAIRAASDQWQRDVAAQNLDAIVALHAPDAVVMMSHAPLVNGTTAIHDAWGQMVKTPGLVLHWTPTKIEQASPTVATEYGTYTESYNSPSGKMTDAGNYVTIWHKINGKWRVALDAPITATPLPAAPMAMAETQILSTSALKWNDFPVPGFDPGMKLAVLSGNPGESGPYVVRLQFPAGYRFPVHWHPGIENLTVVSGTFQLGMGNTADLSALKDYAPGDFLYIPPRHSHFGGSSAAGPSVIQLHGQGPFQVILGAPK
jgi:ketosteroid isomerase-like protein/quercetin dioxygenase-like cupin family protein